MPTSTEGLASPIRILHVFGRLDYGGAEMRTIELTRQINRIRYQPHFCVLSLEPGVLDQELLSMDIPIHRMSLDLSIAIRFWRLLRRERFDVVHAHLHDASGLFLVLAHYAGVPVRVAHYRGPQDGRSRTLRRRIQRDLLRGWIARYATHILAVSKATMASAWNEKWTQDPRCRVLYNGIDLHARGFSDPPDPSGVRAEFGIETTAPLFIHIGRFSPEKNHAKLISIFREILNVQPAARLLLVGTGDAAIQRTIQKSLEVLGIQDQVLFAGQRSDIPRLLKASELLFLPSTWEGLPGVVLEASAIGTPVLASDLPGLREIADYLPAVFLESVDAPSEAWAETALRIAARATASAARARAMEDFGRTPFSIEANAELICRVWDNEQFAPPV